MHPLVVITLATAVANIVCNNCNHATRSVPVVNARLPFDNVYDLEWPNATLYASSLLTPEMRAALTLQCASGTIYMRESSVKRTVYLTKKTCDNSRIDDTTHDLDVVCENVPVYMGIRLVGGMSRSYGGGFVPVVGDYAKVIDADVTPLYVTTQEMEDIVDTECVEDDDDDDDFNYDIGGPGWTKTYDIPMIYIRPHNS